MNIGAIFIILAILLLTALYIAHPLLENKSSKATRTNEGLSSLLAERERLLAAIEELDFDHELGKIDKEEYSHQRQILLQQGAAILQQLEQSDLEPAAALKEPEDSLEALIAARKRELKGEKKGKFCPQCGQGIQTSDKFCAKCGANL